MRTVCTWYQSLYRVLGVTLAAALLASLGLVMGGGAASASPLFPPLPDQDPFYHPKASRFVNLRPGDIIAARPVQLANLSFLPTIPQVRAWQISFRSTDGHGKPIAAVTTVAKPVDGRGDHNRPLFSNQIEEDALGTMCAPSYVLRWGSLPSSFTGAATVSYDFALLQLALVRGYAVNIPDHEGPKAALSAGPIAGHITLDSVRAATRFKPMALAGSATKVALVGYSGGTVPTMFAAQQQHTYAPEVNIVGSAAGGILADFDAGLKYNDGKPGSAIWFSGLVGISRDNPKLAQFLDRHLTPLGRAVRAVQTSGACGAYSATTLPFMPWSAVFDTNIFANPAVIDALNANRMGQQAPVAPLFMYHAVHDWLVPITAVDRTFNDYRALGAPNVTYIRDNLLEHLTLQPSGVNPVMEWVTDRFAGRRLLNGTSVKTVPTLAGMPGPQ